MFLNLYVRHKWPLSLWWQGANRLQSEFARGCRGAQLLQVQFILGWDEMTFPGLDPVALPCATKKYVP